MKLLNKRIFLTLLIILFFPLLNLGLELAHKQEKQQRLQEEAIAINVEVPVRVFKGDKFVDNLTIDNFEVY